MKHVNLMTEEEALEYIKYLEKNEELDGTDPIFNKYAHFAATIANEWYKKNKKPQSISLGECIRVANTGLILAAQLYRRHNRDVQFRHYSKQIILAELENLKKK